MDRQKLSSLTLELCFICLVGCQGEMSMDSDTSMRSQPLLNGLLCQWPRFQTSWWFITVKRTPMISWSLNHKWYVLSGWLNHCNPIYWGQRVIIRCSSLTWPEQQRPGKAAWLLWKLGLTIITVQTIFCCHIGKWISPSHQQWFWYIWIQWPLLFFPSYEMMWCTYNCTQRRHGDNTRSQSLVKYNICNGTHSKTHVYWHPVFLLFISVQKTKVVVVLFLTIMCHLTYGNIRICSDCFNIIK